MSPAAAPQVEGATVPAPGQLVRVRSRSWLVAKVVPAARPSEQTLLRLSCLDGAAHGGLSIPARHGRLSSPNAYPFLEGRPRRSHAVPGERLAKAPRVSDGVVLRDRTNLLVLDGERISCRALDVEQIGPVSEAIMGFRLRAASGPVVAPPIRKKGSAVDPYLDAASLLALPGAGRAKRLKEKALAALKAAKSPDDLASALGKKLSRRTPRPLPAGSLYLQPTEERRRSGSHDTARSLTEPIVRTTLEPVLAALGDSPTPEQVLALKVCDPAMGSGAFLVEACRHLGDALLRAWEAHGGLPEIPPDEDPVLFARRQVAQLCLYGVDKNPFAVDPHEARAAALGGRPAPRRRVTASAADGTPLLSGASRRRRTFDSAPGPRIAAAYDRPSAGATHCFTA